MRATELEEENAALREYIDRLVPLIIDHAPQALERR